MKLPPPHRFSHFPGSMIFGKTIVPVYYTGHGPTIPLIDVARAIGVPPPTAFRLIERNREAILLVDAVTFDKVPPSSPLSPLKNRICLGMDGICMLILSIDHSLLHDPLTRKRIVLAKQWLLAQFSNRIKISGRKNQPRWDIGLTKRQARIIKKRLSLLPNAENK